MDQVEKERKIVGKTPRMYRDRSRGHFAHYPVVDWSGRDHQPSVWFAIGALSGIVFSITFAFGALYAKLIVQESWFEGVMMSVETQNTLNEHQAWLNEHALQVWREGKELTND
jgi:hypothetical protein